MPEWPNQLNQAGFEAQPGKNAPTSALKSTTFYNPNRLISD
jgi:hypothetical protein